MIARVVMLEGLAFEWPVCVSSSIHPIFGHPSFDIMPVATEKINANPRVFAAKKGAKRETRGLWGDVPLLDDEADMERSNEEETIDEEEVYGAFLV